MTTNMIQLISRIFPLLLGMTFICVFTGLYTYADEKESTSFYFVGLGPGDVDLMTLRAVNVIEKADVVFCSEGWEAKLAEYLEDKDVHNGYWRLFPYYGREPSEFEGNERRECEEYIRKRGEFIALVRAAVDEGKTVAMLDGGDPLVYGPSAWALEEFEDLNPVVVPGLSCFNAGNAALRRCVTTSDHTKSVILTAADWLGGEDTIESLSAHQTTMVLFTMRTEFREFVEKLSINYPPETPIALVKNAGNVANEEVIESTLGEVLDKVGEKGPGGAYLIYIGDFLSHRYNDENAEGDNGSN